MNKSISHSDLNSLAEKLKVSAGRFMGNLANSIEFKEQNDAVTSFDYYLQDQIIESLAIIDPNAICVSEEFIGSNADTEIAWVVDPLDGTSNYIQGLRPNSIALAKVEGDKVLAALVIDLSTMDTYSAVKDRGARLNGKSIRPRDLRIRLMGSSTGYLKRGGILPDGWNTRVIGSQALQLCMVASGVLGANISYEAKAWDDVAGSLIVQESGGYYEHQFGGVSWLELAVLKRPIRSKATAMTITDDDKQIILELINE